MRPILLLGALVALALPACGNDPRTGAGMEIARSALGPVAARLTGRKAEPAPALSDAEIRSRIAAAGVPVVRLRAEKTGAVVYATLGARNGDVATWSAAEGISVSLRNGVLVATRGLDADLMLASGVSAARISSGGAYTRQHEYLDGADVIQTLSYDCTARPAGAEAVTILGVAYSARKVTEACAGPGGTFENEYWYAGGGILQSRQVVHPGLGRLEIQYISR